MEEVQIVGPQLDAPTLENNPNPKIPQSSQSPKNSKNAQNPEPGAPERYKFTPKSPSDSHQNAQEPKKSKIEQASFEFSNSISGANQPSTDRQLGPKTLLDQSISLNKHEKGNSELYHEDIELINLRNRHLLRGNNSASQNIEELAMDVRNIKYIEIGARISAGLLLLLVIWYFGEGSYHVESSNLCIKDRIFQVFDDQNKFVIHNRLVASVVQVCTSAVLDLNLVSMMAYWMKYEGNGAPIYMLLMFYGTRAVVQQTFKMRFPVGFYWESPGIPSITVPYGKASDFYFSGHVGFMAMGMGVWNQRSLTWVSVLIAFLTPFVAYSLVLFRVHYSIDIVVGLFFGYYSFKAAYWMGPWVDAKVKRYLCPRFWSKLLVCE